MIKRVMWFGVPIAVLALLVALMVIATQGASMPVIDTRGVIADAQRDTLMYAVLIMSIIIVPVFILTLFIAIRYRAGNTRSKYLPEWASSKSLEFIWWGVPVLIVTALSVMTWQTSHSLDPYRALESVKKPVQVQVVALQWKWLFIYPELGVASVNELAIPVDTPVEFTITSDAPMNSFWIPQLGGQIYAMAGMSTKLHLSAREPGTYRGVSANLSGEGHAEMDFETRATADETFSAWVNEAKTKSPLTSSAYEQLRLPSKKQAVTHYRLDDTALYDTIVARYDHGHSAEVSH